MTTLSGSSNSDKGCEDCPGEGWCMHQERQRWARRRGNDWPVSPLAAAVLDEDAARRPQGTIGDRARAVAATLRLQRVPWYASEPKPGSAPNPKTGIEYWTGVSPETLEARREWPEWAKECVQAIERILARTVRDPAFAGLDSATLARDAAFLALGQPAELEDGLPSAFLAVLPVVVSGALRRSLVIAALDLRTTDEVARLIRQTELREDQEPDNTIAHELVERSERRVTLVQWRAIETLDTDQTLTRTFECLAPAVGSHRAPPCSSPTPPIP